MCAPNSALSRDKSKSPSHSLAGRFIAEGGLNLAQVRVALEAVDDHIVDYYGETREPGAIVHTAVSASEPAGKPIWTCKVVPVQLTFVHPADVEVLRNKGSVELRMVRLYRFCREAQQQRSASETNGHAALRQHAEYHQQPAGQQQRPAAADGELEEIVPVGRELARADTAAEVRTEAERQHIACDGNQDQRQREGHYHHGGECGPSVEREAHDARQGCRRYKEVVPRAGIEPAASGSSVPRSPI